MMYITLCIYIYIRHINATYKNINKLTPRSRTWSINMHHDIVHVFLAAIIIHHDASWCVEYIYIYVYIYANVYIHIHNILYVTCIRATHIYTYIHIHIHMYHGGRTAAPHSAPASAFFNKMSCGRFRYNLLQVGVRLRYDIWYMILVSDWDMERGSRAPMELTWADLIWGLYAFSFTWIMMTLHVAHINGYRCVNK